MSIETLLKRAAPFLRLPQSSGRLPEITSDGAALRCPSTGCAYSLREGVLDLLDREPDLRGSQKALDNPWMAFLYDRLRSTALRRLLGLPPFSVEVERIQRRQHIQPGDTVLDLACGHGNFTVALARRVGPSGLVLGVDASRAMLARAVERVRRQRMDNVLLVRGDALKLPLANGCTSQINCSGGFHQFPDLPQALCEIARVSRPGAILTASTFAEHPRDPRARLKRWLKRRYQWHFVPLGWLGEQLAALGFRDYRWSLPGGWFGYASAQAGE